jgi:hypothetical protein
MVTSEQYVVTKEQFEAWFLSARKMHENALSASEGIWQPEVRTRFNRIQKACLDLDPEFFTKQEHEQAWHLLSTELPAWLALTVQLLVDKGSETVYSGGKMVRVHKKLLRSVSQLRRQQVVKQLDQQMTTLRLAIEAPQQLAPLTFPKVSNVHKRELAHSLSALKSDWEAAHQFATSAEDEYLLEQIAKQYLPDSLHLYESMVASEEMQVEAQDLLARQVRVLSSQVRQLLDRRSGDALTAMRAQTEFIEELGRRSQPSQLELRRA